VFAARPKGKAAAARHVNRIALPNDLEIMRRIRFGGWRSLLVVVCQRGAEITNETAFIYGREGLATNDRSICIYSIQATMLLYSRTK
jgi:hypothetical protein